MALVVKDRVQETSTTTGTGTFTLAGAVSGFQSFSAIGDGNTTYYAIVGGAEWEVGIGTYTASGTLLSRDTILESSNGGTAVNFSAGTKNVFVTYPAEKGLYLDVSGNAIALGTPASATLTNATGLPIVAGTTGTLTVARGGTGTSTAFTTGSVVFAGASGTYTQDNTNFFWDDTNNRLGIGTTSPDAKLTIAGEVSAQQIAGRYFGFGTTGFSFDSTTVNYYGITYTQPTSPSTTYNTVLSGFSNIKFTTGTTEKMRIDSSGNVGIGTTSGNEKLNVVGAGKFTGAAVSLDQNGAYIDYSSSIARIAGQGTSGGTLAFYTNPNGGFNTERMRIDSTGNILVAQAARGTITTDNDLSFDMNAASNFKCTPTALGTLTFTNITSGQSGFVLLVNTGGYAISAAATTEVSSSALAVISTAGTYLLSYFSDGTNVFVTNSGALA